ncbi:hypothetical protein BCV70DRAFT_42618 [Testicularia cyperi]|uniref:Uncharacterized protein n=1 Tax=Testicularia cyperi TaxID=1882483 RepID=A0A317XJ42_9BASI|nr:hypothetical protein BCV70DRAFT_42618 [Testicularia cyperi]
MDRLAPNHNVFSGSLLQSDPARLVRQDYHWEIGPAAQSWERLIHHSRTSATMLSCPLPRQRCSRFQPTRLRPSPPIGWSLEDAKVIRLSLHAPSLSGGWETGQREISPAPRAGGRIISTPADLASAVYLADSPEVDTAKFSHCTSTFNSYKAKSPPRK